MSHPDRLLIVATSRYDCLLMRRELADHLPDTIITTMIAAEAGLNELNNNNYDTLILELNSFNEAREFAVTALEQIIAERSDMLTILLSSASETDVQVAQIKRLGKQIVAERLLTLTKTTSYEKLLADYIISYYALVVDIVPANTPYLTNQERVTWIDPTDLAGQLAHEINNPLMMITGTAELLLKNEPNVSREVCKKMKIILRSANRIKTAINRLKEQEQRRV